MIWFAGYDIKGHTLLCILVADDLVMLEPGHQQLQWVVVVTLFPTKYMKTHKYNPFIVVNTQNVHMYCVSGCQKKSRLLELGPDSI